MTPMIVSSELTGRWYVVTRWKRPPDEKGRGVSARKYDVTEQMLAIFAARETPE